VRLNDDLYVLALPFVREGQSMPLNLCLLVDAVHGPTLVDAGLPGQQDAIVGEVALAGVQVQQLKRIVLTHQDIDHVGSLPWLARTSGAQVLAYEVEAPFIDGSATPRFAAPEVLARRPEMRAVVEQMQPTPIDKALRDGDTLDVSGGVRVVATPGHTVGHMCLYLERSRTLIAGDALSAREGRLLGPSESATQDMATASASVRKLAALDVDSIVCYHGGVVGDDANRQLRRVAAELSA
jgi:glyoxylase-like metal-dependent hydrolase (beta-lactamase superfamily II)